MVGSRSFILSLSCLSLATVTAVGPVVHLDQGVVEGQEAQSHKLDRVYYRFLGIPYAQPPVGDLRFLRPRKALKWEGVLKADKHIKCAGLQMPTREVDQSGTEDCLVLNVFTPKVSNDKRKNELLPVLFFIHGGGFASGSGLPEMYGPKRIMDEDVVMVSINYRLSVLGFFSLGDNVIGGNQGLWDQLMALQWVQDNIKEFGGDPKRVTIVGESAGAVSATWLFLSPAGKGLFSGAVALSGVPNSPFSALPKHPGYYGRSFAWKAGCDPEADSEQILQCLQKLPWSKLLELTTTCTPYLMSPNAFGPSVDSMLSDPLLPDDPNELIRMGNFNHVPIIFVHNRDEGVLLSSFAQKTNLIDWTTTDALLHMSGKALDEVEETDHSMVSEVIKTYFNGHLPSLSSKKEKEFFTDVIFGAIGHYTALEIAKSSRAPVYECFYEHPGSISMAFLAQGSLTSIIATALLLPFGLNPYGNPEQVVTHGDNLLQLFLPEQLPFDTVITEGDKNVSTIIIESLANFAASGDPSVKKHLDLKWTKVKPEKAKLLRLSSSPCMDDLPPQMSQRYEFWEKLWNKYGLRMLNEESVTFKNGNKDYEKCNEVPGYQRNEL